MRMRQYRHCPHQRQLAGDALGAGMVHELDEALEILSGLLQREPELPANGQIVAHGVAQISHGRAPGHGRASGLSRARSTVA
jgi:hypothetical protein